MSGDSPDYDLKKDAVILTCDIEDDIVDDGNPDPEKSGYVKAYFLNTYHWDKSKYTEEQNKKIQEMVNDLNYLFNEDYQEYAERFEPDFDYPDNDYPDDDY